MINCDEDADCKIVEVALTASKLQDSCTLVVADDTDIFVMLLYHWQTEMNDIFLFQTRSRRTWSIKKCQNEIATIKEHLLFAHAFTGCDTTSAVFAKGKGNFVKLLRKSVNLQNASRVMSNFNSAPDDVGSASLTAFKVFYGGSVQQSLSEIRLAFVLILSICINQ